MVSDSGTSPAHTVAECSDVGVRFVEKMTAYAICLSGPASSRPNPTQNVHSVSHNFHMRWIDTGWIPAKVVDNKPLWNWTDKHRV